MGSLLSKYLLSLLPDRAALCRERTVYRGEARKEKGRLYSERSQGIEKEKEV
jgi:hypothetical protein